MFISRATRHDLGDIEDFFAAAERRRAIDIKEGTFYVARSGAVIGTIRMVEVAPQTVVLDDVLVAEEKRGEGIGKALMQAAMNAKGGKLFLCCHPETIPFYEGFGFSEIPLEACPPEAVAYWERSGDAPAPEGHDHHYLTAR